MPLGPVAGAQVYSTGKAEDKQRTGPAERNGNQTALQPPPRRTRTAPQKRPVVALHDVGSINYWPAKETRWRPFKRKTEHGRTESKKKAALGRGGLFRFW